MLNRAIRRTFSQQAVQAGDTYERVRLIKYVGPNLNVASHNVERRPQYKEDFNFWTTLNIGNEGFSHCHIVNDMNPIYGSRNEWIWLFGILLCIPLLATGRKTNEDGLNAAVGNATNRYAKMNLDGASANMSLSL